MHSIDTLQSLGDDELLRRLGELVSRSRRGEADLVAHIGEVDERRLYAREACSSMFVYCAERLHLSEPEAYLRITVARAARKHPMLLAMLGDGSLHLSGIALLAPLLTEQNRDGVLERARHASKRRVEELVAELSPRPDAPSLMRKLPQRRTASAIELRPGGVAETVGLCPDSVGGVQALCRDGVAAVTPAAPAVIPDPSSSGAGALELGLGGAREGGTAGNGARAVTNELRPDGVAGLPPRPVPCSGPERKAIVEPLSLARYKVQFTANAELHDKLERLQALMRSEVPDGDLAAIIERAVTEKLERLEARRFGKTAAPRKKLAETDTSPASRHVPAAVRRAVRERDGDRCHYVDAQGRRCSERDGLEFHHLHPFGMGGDHNAENVRLVCSAHNRYLAEYDYGQSALRRHKGSTKHSLRQVVTHPG